jgi:uncharacterized RDD family membrane protein YckC
MKRILQIQLLLLLGLLLPLCANAVQDETPQTTTPVAVEATATPPQETSPTASPEPQTPEHVWIAKGEVIAFGKDAVLAANERASKVVAFGGNAVVHGKVDGEVVAIGGDVDLDGPAEKAVAIFGDVRLGPKASVTHEVVAIGGAVANPHGLPVDPKTLDMAKVRPQLAPLLEWLGDVAGHGRPLSPHIRWPWYWFWGCTGLLLLLAAAFGRAVGATASTLEQRPGSVIVTTLILVPLLPLLVLLLVATGVGILLLPVVALALLAAGAFGKAALLAWIGRGILRASGADRLLDRTWLTVLLGALVLAVVYCVPVLGILVWATAAWLALGLAATALINRRRQEMMTAHSWAPVSATPPSTPTPASGATSQSSVAGSAADQPPPSTPPLPPSPEALHLHRAEFGVRFAALLVDILLVAIVAHATLVGGFIPFPLAFAGYAFGLWLWKGTTVGGIIFKLKVVRLDGRIMDSATVLVRVLVAFLSVFAAGLGFLWCLWDADRQTWHDKVAGTVVVRVPNSVPLV